MTVMHLGQGYRLTVTRSIRRLTRATGRHLARLRQPLPPELPPELPRRRFTVAWCRV